MAESKGRRKKQEEPADLGLGDFQQIVPADGLSLDELGAAFARMVDEGSDPYEPLPAAPAPGSAPAEIDDLILDEPEASGECPISPQSILEAMLFVGCPSGQPLTSRQIAALMRGVRPQEIDAFVAELNAVYAEEGCPYRIVSSGSGYRMQLLDEYAGLRDKFYGRVKEAKLTQSAVDVLAVIAYRQPLTRDQVDALRGKPSSGVLSQLVRRRLLRMERPPETPRQPLYYTTERFLKLFGLQDLAELPQGQDEDKVL